jgi:ABC-type multidrug transport system permease subunit
VLDVEAQYFPQPAFFVDNFHQMLPGLGSVYLIVALFSLCQKLLQTLVGEKEQQVKEGMLMMGLREPVYLWGWFLTYTVIALVPVTVISILSKVLTFYPHSSTMLFFVLLLLFAQTLLMLAFFLSTLVDTVKVALQVLYTNSILTPL